MEDGVKQLTDIPAINRFLSYCRVRTVPSKTVLIHAGDLPDVLYYIIRGSVEVMIEDEDGNEMVLAYLNKGQFFGEMGLFSDSQQRSAWVRTRTQCELAEMTYPRFRQVASESPGLVFELATQLATRLDRTNRKLGDLAFVDVTGRIAHAIMDLCGEPDAMTHPQGMQIKVSRQELSRLVGCSREMAGRVLKVLEEQGTPDRARQDDRGVRRAAAESRRPRPRARQFATAAARRRPLKLAADCQRLLAGDRRAHRADRRRVVLRAEDRAAGDERIGARSPRSAPMLSSLTPPSISSRISRPLGVDALPRFAQLAEHRRDELLAAEARVHRHQEHEVDLLQRVVEPGQRRRRVQHEPGPAARRRGSAGSCGPRDGSPPGES